MKKTSCLLPLMIALLTVSALSAQGIGERDIVPLKNWDAPTYWHPSAVESKGAAARQLLGGNSGMDRAPSITPQAQTPANSLVFVGMTPCRVVDTRTGSGFTGAFGPPILVGGVGRTFPIQLSPQCLIPSIAQAYSFNITVVPPGFLDYITVWPTGQAQPNASTLNGYIGTVIANAAIVPAGTGGSVDVFASQNTHLIIDINGYYAPQSGITLVQGTAGAPSLSFSGDAGTGMFSSASGTVDIAAGGTTRLSVRSNGITDVNGKLNILAQDGIGITGFQPFLTLTDTNGGKRGRIASGGGDLSFFPESSFQTGIAAMTVKNLGNVGIGTASPNAMLEVLSPSLAAVRGVSNTNAGVAGVSDSGYGTFGFSGSGFGMYGSSNTGTGVYGYSSAGSAALFEGLVRVIGFLDVNNYTAGGTDAVCRNGVRLAVCSSSLRYKTDVQPFGSGLELLSRLRPISFTWKSNGMADLGLGAEDVAAIEPRLVTRNERGEVEGVKYDHLNVVLINAVKEQQAQIDQQRAEINLLKELICQQQPHSTVCP